MAAPVQSHKTRDWGSQTPFAKHFGKTSAILDVYIMFRDHGLQATLDLIPDDCDFVRGWIPQCERFENCTVMLVLGMCRLHAGVPCMESPTCYTEELIASLERLPEVKVLCMDLRKECKRKRVTEKSPLGSNCDEILESEAAKLILATAIELAIASKYFGIKFGAVVSYSAIWSRQYKGLCDMDKQLGRTMVDVGSTPIPEHLGHLGGDLTHLPNDARFDAKTRAFERVSEQLAPLLGFDGVRIYRAF
ncbi:hypothetical protein B0A48_16382 [Cryoendolithus antarcticus]|uniref:Uncharacterized protein n=1 Tax=Cryoendolithus antarcticus TaxID=1507870 RepID=A0A1V8SDS8_9PEZI|nr:hypothetical protein B0A48_16382 [Cryoendolithus antarcticus]